jgi:hypothetical protein
MEPGGDTYLPAHYIFRVFDARAERPDSEYPVLFFQMGSPFPRYEVGDLMRTIAWPLGQEGRLATVEKVLHSSWSIGDQMWFEQDVYCRFALPIRER